MPLSKFRNVTEMKRGGTWRAKGDPTLFRAMAGLWEIGERTPRRFPPGVFKHRSVDEMNTVQRDWRDSAFRAWRASRGCTLRRATAADRAAIVALVVRALADVGYAALSPVFAAAFAGDRQALAAGMWDQAIVAIVDGVVVGVALTTGDVIDDLWVDGGHRGHGIGRALLLGATDEIAQRGHARASLRVVAANARAVAFYQANGWQIVDRVQHERFGFEMLRMSAPSRSRKDATSQRPSGKEE